jgi:hypothetical protein
MVCVVQRLPILGLGIKQAPALFRNDVGPSSAGENSRKTYGEEGIH